MRLVELAGQCNIDPAEALYMLMSIDSEFFDSGWDTLSIYQACVRSDRIEQAREILLKETVKEVLRAAKGDEADEEESE